MADRMLQRKVTHQIKLPISISIILGLIAFGHLFNVLEPILNIEEAFAAGEIHKIALCNKTDEYCAGVTKGRKGHLMVNN